MFDVLKEIYNRIWRGKEWPTPWTQSCILHSLKGQPTALLELQNYLPKQSFGVSHDESHFNRFNLQAKEIIAEGQAGFRAERSTTEQIFKLRILCEKYLQHKQKQYHVLIDFQKAFNRVWLAATRATIRKHNVSANLDSTI